MKSEGIVLMMRIIIQLTSSAMFGIAAENVYVFSGCCFAFAWLDLKLN